MTDPRRHFIPLAKQQIYTPAPTAQRTPFALLSLISRTSDPAATSSFTFKWRRDVKSSVEYCVSMQVLQRLSETGWRSEKSMRQLFELQSERKRWSFENKTWKCEGAKMFWVLSLVRGLALQVSQTVSLDSGCFPRQTPTGRNTDQGRDLK